MAASFVGGIAAHAFDERVFGTPVVVAGGVSLIGAIADRHKIRRLLWMCCLAAMLGIARYDAVLASLPKVAIVPNGERSLRATISRATIGQKSAILIGDRVSFLDGAALPGKIEIVASLSSRVRSGDEVSFRCRLIENDLSAPRRIIDGIVWRCFPRDGPKILQRARHRNVIEMFQEHARTVVGRTVPEPEASLVLGMAIGDRTSVPAELNDDFRAAGVSHILAVSGYNVTKVAELSLLMFAVAGIKRRRALFGTIFCLVIFAAVSGAGAPVVRATIMGSLSLIAALCRRRHYPTNALVLSAAVMLAVEPFLLRHDLPFALSFSAVWGLSALGAPLARAWSFLPEALGFRKTLAETIGASLATLPFLLAIFGILPLIAPFTNIIVLPLVPLTMVLGMIIIALGSIADFLAIPAALAAIVVLRWMETVISAFAELPWNPTLTVGPLAACFIAFWILLLAYALGRKEDKRQPL